MFWQPLILLSVLSIVLADENPCTTHHNGKFYDLSPLKLTSKDYEFNTSANHLFSINVCRSPVRETFGLNDVDSPDIGGFVRRDHGDFSIGTLNTTIAIEDSRPRIIMMNGSRCKSKSGNTDIRASTVIEFVCDTSISGNGKPRLVAQLPPGDDETACAFFIEWKTSVACPTNEPGGVWSFFGYLIMTLMILVLLYLTAGTIYNRYVLQLRGVDQIPRFSLESMKYHGSEIMDWFKDLATGMRSGGAYNRTSSDSYRSALPTHRTAASAGMNPVSHQTQVSNPKDEGDNSGFVRPQPRGFTTTGRINPVSHQAQTSTSDGPQPPHNQPSPPVLPPKNSKLKPPPMNLASTAEEREFMLGEDEDGDEGDVLTATTETQLGAPVPTLETKLEPAQGSQSTQTGDSFASVHERGMDSEGVIRL